MTFFKSLLAKKCKPAEPFAPRIKTRTLDAFLRFENKEIKVDNTANKDPIFFTKNEDGETIYKKGTWAKPPQGFWPPDATRIRTVLPPIEDSDIFQLDLDYDSPKNKS